MNDLRNKWIDALRSEEYIQGTVILGSQERGGFCCLGVACHLAVQEGIIDSYDPTKSDLDEYDEVMEALGLSSPVGDYSSSHRVSSLAYDNDNKFSFKQIADIIESEPRGLFE